MGRHSPPVRPPGNTRDKLLPVTLATSCRAAGGGKPCILGLRITVYDVLEYLASGMTEKEILSDFPDLTENDIRACLAFAVDRERRFVTVPAS